MTFSIDGTLSKQIYIAIIFSLSQPIFSVINANPDFLPIRGFDVLQLVTLTALLGYLIPTTFSLTIPYLLRTLPPQINRYTESIVMLALLFPFSLTAVNALPNQNTILLILESMVFAIILTTLLSIRNASNTTFTNFAFFCCLILPIYFIAITADWSNDVAAAEVDLGQIADQNTPIIVLVFDELPLSTLINPNMEVDQNSFPNFHAFSQHATWFKRATTVADYTHISIPSILSGVYAHTTVKDMENPQVFDDWLNKPSARHYPVNAFTILEKTREINAFEHSTSICPRSICPQQKGNTLNWRNFTYDLGIVYLHGLLPSALTQNLPKVDRSWSDFAQKTVAEYEKNSKRFDDFTTSLANINENSFSFHHSSFPHEPWNYTALGQRYANTSYNDRDGDIWSPIEVITEVGFIRHFLQSQYADLLLGRFINQLYKADLYDKAYIVITSDHGASFIPGENFRAVNKNNMYGVLPVPLFVKEPYQKIGALSKRAVHTMDILPSIVDFLGGSEYKFDGIPFHQQDQGDSILVDILLKNRTHATFTLSDYDRHLTAIAQSNLNTLDRYTQNLAMHEQDCRVGTELVTKLNSLERNLPLLVISGVITDTAMNDNDALCLMSNNQLIGRTSPFYQHDSWRFIFLLQDAIDANSLLNLSVVATAQKP